MLLLQTQVPLYLWEVLLGVLIWSQVLQPSLSTLEENFDPSKADPYMNITCLGDKFPFLLPVEPGFDPNQKSMQQICAKPQFNGGEPFQHLGGYCWNARQWNTNHENVPSTGLVTFDKHPLAKTSQLLSNPRAYLACAYRCFCNIGLADDSVQPRNNVGGQWGRLGGKVYWESSDLSYEIKVDIFDDFNVPQASHQGTLGADVVKARMVSHLEQPFIGQAILPNAIAPSRISLDPANKIRCAGAVPQFPLPGPFTSSDFADIQQFCAVQLNGGTM